MQSVDTYQVHDLMAESGWSVAMLEIMDSPRHYHRIEKELFVVVQGELDIEVDGEHEILGVGTSIEIQPGKIHQLKSALKTPVKVLCINFPAFDPSDMIAVEE